MTEKENLSFFKPPFFKSLQLTTDNSIMYDNLKRSTVSVLTPHKCLAKAFTNRKKKIKYTYPSEY